MLKQQPPVSIPFFSRRGYLYWSEGIGDAIYRSAMNGSNIETLLNTSIEVVGERKNLMHTVKYHNNMVPRQVPFPPGIV